MWRGRRTLARCRYFYCLYKHFCTVKTIIAIYVKRIQYKEEIQFFFYLWCFLRCKRAVQWRDALVAALIFRGILLNFNESTYCTTFFFRSRSRESSSHFYYFSSISYSTISITSIYANRESQSQVTVSIYVALIIWISKITGSSVSSYALLSF